MVAALQPLPPPAVDNAVARAGAERPPQRRTGRRQRQPLPRAVGRHPATRAPGRALHQISPSPRGRTRFPAAADHAAFCVVARPRPSTPTGQTRTAAGMLRVGAAGGSLPTHRGGGRRAVLAGDAPPRAAHCPHASLCAAGTSGRSRGGGWRYTTWIRWRRGAGRRSRRRVPRRGRVGGGGGEGRPWPGRTAASAPRHTAGVPPSVKAGQVAPAGRGHLPSVVTMGSIGSKLQNYNKEAPSTPPATMIHVRHASVRLGQSRCICHRVSD